MKISSDEAFLILRKWQVELTPVVLVGSLMPRHPLRGRIAVVTRNGVWNSSDKPISIWGFSLTGKEANFLASKFEDFEYLEPAEVDSEVKMSLPEAASEQSVLALTQVTKLPTGGRTPTSIQEKLFLVEDETSLSTL